MRSIEDFHRFHHVHISRLQSEVFYSLRLKSCCLLLKFRYFDMSELLCCFLIVRLIPCFGLTENYMMSSSISLSKLKNVTVNL